MSLLLWQTCSHVIHPPSPQVTTAKVSDSYVVMLPKAAFKGLAGSGAQHAAGWHPYAIDASINPLCCNPADLSAPPLVQWSSGHPMELWPL